ncbi:hypothetical protein LCGC14_1009400 [marine sediment metagenome]|uniref:Uncharacterized protein n=1 Tax=marine sediment metagenome TaxID=412755 RepID=A0A0F9QJ00_9ZZZZ
MLTVYAKGMVCCSVCTDLNNLKEIEFATNVQNPTEIESKWKISGEKTFKGGQSMPCPCHDNPETHKHYLLNC